MAASPQDVLGFWRSAGPTKWFAKDKAFDEAMGKVEGKVQGGSRVRSNW